MSFLTGVLSGSLVAGGIYYAVFSQDLQARTSAHQRDLKALAGSLQDPRARGTLPAAARIPNAPHAALFKQRWNEEIEGLFRAVRRWDRALVEFGRRLVGDR